MLSKLSYLNSYITLTLGYLNPALNNSALEVRLNFLFHLPGTSCAYTDSYRFWCGHSLFHGLEAFDVKTMRQYYLGQKRKHGKHVLTSYKISTNLGARDFSCTVSGFGHVFWISAKFPGEVGRTPHMKSVGMLVVSLRGVNFGFGLT